MKKDDTVYLIHILKAVSFIEAYTQDLSEKDFQSITLFRTELSGKFRSSVKLLKTCPAP